MSKKSTNKPTSVVLAIHIYVNMHNFKIHWLTENKYIWNIFKKHNLQEMDYVWNKLNANKILWKSRLQITCYSLNFQRNKYNQKSINRNTDTTEKPTNLQNTNKTSIYF